MSEPTLPAPRSERASSGEVDKEARSENTAHPSSEADAKFVNQTLESVGSGESSTSTSKLGVKTKSRKRTSPEDQAVLEAEYSKNPKPDKAARLEIVKRVRLTEKEVQIWFQNRRQNTRRKSRPLLPHEIAAFGLGGVGTLSSDPVMSSSQDSLPDSHTHPSTAEDAERQTSLTRAEEPPSSSAPARLITSKLPTMADKEDAREGTLPSLLSRSQSFTSGLSFAHSSSQPLLPTLGYLANRRHAPSSSFNSYSTPLSSMHAHPMANSPVPYPPQPSSCPERVELGKSSRVRLSLSLSGKAELVPASSSSSPPRPNTPPSGPSFSQSTQSALSAHTGPSSPTRRRLNSLQRSQSLTNPPKIPRLHSGRSRDARTWEFACDADAHDELTMLANQESSGSAVAAISLLRSTSSTGNLAGSASALKSNSNKRNALSQGNAMGESKRGGKRTKLGRAASGVSRLGSGLAKERMVAGNGNGRGKDDDPAGGRKRSDSGGDSDKENWLPISGEVVGNATRRRPLPTGPPPASRGVRQRRVLGNNNSVPTLAPDFGGSRGRTKGSKSRDAKGGNSEIFEDVGGGGEAANGVVDEEVQKFMRGEVSPSKKGELDCVHSLLSLSQANWR